MGFFFDFCFNKLIFGEAKLVKHLKVGLAPLFMDQIISERCLAKLPFVYSYNANADYLAVQI